jgi:hypothetical protein
VEKTNKRNKRLLEGLLHKNDEIFAAGEEFKEV